MSLKIYDTQARELREFHPLTEGKVGMYICGLTTQGLPHIGHMRFAVSFDILRRWLTRGHGYEVTLVRNVTDIDDKILRKSAEQGLRWWELSYANEQATAASLATLGILPPTYEPRATGHVPEMIELIQSLVDRGHAYPSQGDVYFDVKSFPEYGSLTHQGVDDMEPAEDADPRGKRDPRDFALWKAAKEGEPETASWETPWGRGRPGWHIECSAMARKYLGDAFDIHGGAVDLRFPHHENEQAQSHAAGLPFTTYWMHNAWLTIKGEKMSKSVGESLGVDHLTAQYEPLVVRYYLSAAHYRSTIEYHPDALPEAQAAVDRLAGFVERAVSRLDVEPDAVLAEAATCELPADYVTAMDDDLGVPGAMAVVFETVRRGNSALDDGDEEALREALVQVVAMADVIGVNPLAPHWRGGGASGGEDAGAAALEVLVESALEDRARARQERDFAAADAIRDRLTAAGIAIEDTPAGARWSVAKKG